MWIWFHTLWPAQFPFLKPLTIVKNGASNTFLLWLDLAAHDQLEMGDAPQTCTAWVSCLIRTHSWWDQRTWWCKWSLLMMHHQSRFVQYARSNVAISSLGDGWPALAKKIIRCTNRHYSFNACGSNINHDQQPLIVSYSIMNKRFYYHWKFPQPCHSCPSWGDCAIDQPLSIMFTIMLTIITHH